MSRGVVILVLVFAAIGLSSLTSFAQPTLVSEWSVPGVRWMALAPDGSIYAVCYNAPVTTVHHYNGGGVLLSVIDGHETARTSFGNVRSIAVANDGVVYIPDDQPTRVHRYSSTGQYLGPFGSADALPQFGVNGIAVDPQGRVYLGDGTLNRIVTLDGSGSLLTSWPAQGAFDLSLDSAGNIYSFRPLASLFKYSQTGQITNQWGTQGIGENNFQGIHGITCSPFDHVFAADQDGKVLEFSGTNQALIQVIHLPTLAIPLAAYDVVQTAGGDLYISGLGSQNIGRIFHYQEAAVPAQSATWSSIKATTLR